MSNLNLTGVTTNPAGADVLSFGQGAASYAFPFLEKTVYKSRENRSPAQAAASSTTAVHAVVTDNGALQTITTGITNPPCARNLQYTVGGTSANVTVQNITVTGTDIAGQVISETVATTSATVGTIVGTKAFATVTSISQPAIGTGVTVAYGFGNKLGISQYLYTNTIGGEVFLNAVREATAPTVTTSLTSLSNNTVTLNSSLNGTEVQFSYIPHFDQTLVG